MKRPTNRRTLQLESLESREVLSGPSAQQAYMLELLNLARTNPSQAAQRFTTNLSANVEATLAYYNINLPQVEQTIASAPVKPPLAWNDSVASAAQWQSQDQANTGVQSHVGSDGSNFTTRMQRAGYTNAVSTGEDIYAYSTSPDEAMQAFLIDWGVADAGHRMNIQQPNTAPGQAYRDAGVGIVNTAPGSKIGPEIITVDFGSQQNEQATLMGLAYNDLNGDNFYEPGEGQGGVTVTATNLATGASQSTQTQGAGYYALSLAPGNYKVTATEGNLLLNSQNVNVGNLNVEVDYNLSQLMPQAQPISVSSPSVSAPDFSAPANPTPPPPPPPPPAPPSNPTPPPNNPPSSVPQSPVTVPQNTVSNSTLGTIFGSGFSWTSWSSFKVNV